LCSSHVVAHELSIGYDVDSNSPLPPLSHPPPHNRPHAGLGGVTYWLTIFPVDCIKSAMQTDSIVKSQRKYTDVATTAKVSTQLQPTGASWASWLRQRTWLDLSDYLIRRRLLADSMPA
jgi:hypothetical protein